MKFTLSAVVLSLVALTSAVAIEDPAMASHRRDILDLEARQAKAVTTGACCTAGVSKKEDVCTTAAGAAGKVSLVPVIFLPSHGDIDYGSTFEE